MTRLPTESMSEFKARYYKEKMLQEVVDAESLEDLKILLMHWIDHGSIQYRIPPPWEN